MCAPSSNQYPPAVRWVERHPPGFSARSRTRTERPARAASIGERQAADSAPDDDDVVLAHTGRRFARDSPGARARLRCLSSRTTWRQF